MYTNIGRIGTNLEIKRKNKDNMAVLEFSLAFDYGFGLNKRTEWFFCVAFSNAAETIAKKCKKGNRIFVVLEPKTSRGKTKEGVDSYRTDWIVTNFKIIDRAEATAQVDDESSDLPF